MKREEDLWIERHIVTGMIVSTDYLREIRPLWQARLLESETASRLAEWCITHFDKYSVAPKRDIENIYFAKLNNGGLPPEQASSIEGILNDLSTEYERSQFNVQHLIDQTRQYFQERNLKNHYEDIRDSLLGGNLSEAERLASDYHPIVQHSVQALDPFKDSQKIRLAFQHAQKPLIYFGKTLGDFWNHQLVRDAFVALMGPEKIGKTWWLIELAMRAMACDCNVAFFQAGDLSELQMILRLCVWLAKRSDKSRYCNGNYIPVLDCMNNQMGVCRNKQRESRTSPFDANTDFSTVTFDKLVKALQKNPDHRPCRNCENNRGAVWLEYKDPTEPLNWKDAWRKIKRWQRRHNKQFRLATYPNETLTVLEIKTLLDIWEQQEHFVPDVIVVDYADILAPDPDCTRLDYRHQQNKVWQRLRRLSQEKRCLVLTATQSSAEVYDKDRNLRLSDFSETKTKYAHVTAIYGLNQSASEKKIGIIRVNELLVREGDFDRSSQVKVLQRLQTGRPFLSSFK